MIVSVAAILILIAKNWVYTYIYILFFLNFLIEWELPAVTALSWLHFLGFFYKVSFGSFCSIVFLLLRGNHNFFVHTNYTMPHVISVF